MGVRDLAVMLDVPDNQYGIFCHVLDEIMAGGGALLTRKGKVITPAAAGLVFGPYEGNARGFGFVLSADGDVFIPPGSAGDAIHGDKVFCRVTERKAGPSLAGEIVQIVANSAVKIVGTYHDGRPGRVVPDDKRFPVVFIPSEFRNGAKPDQKVVAAIDRRGTGRGFEGKIREVLGDATDVGMDVLAIVIGHGIPHVFPKAVQRAAEDLPDVVLGGELAGRRDFRDLPTVTIDGEDTKDIDDAVSLERLDDGGYRLYVHIADVGHYVRPGSVLWKEALKRGTSVYLADRVIPMLPKKLSNGICSLNPSVDRLALSCVMDIDRDGRVVGQEICRSVVHSDHAVTYEDLADILGDPDSPHGEKYPEFLQIFRDMNDLAGLLRAGRIAQGALEFGFPECKILVDAKGRPTSITRRERNAATSIIEEFMVAANEVVATAYHWMDIPFIYRTHEEPDRAKMEALMNFVRNFGYSMRGGGKRAKTLQNLLGRIENTPEALLISKQVLRSLKQARYSPNPLGHFGLAKAYYSHFTSPIRRFPDLMIHGIIKAHLAGELGEDEIAQLEADLLEICVTSSENERRADACQHDVEQLKKVEYMADKVGQVFDGIISYVAQRGMHVELDNTVEGFVAIESVEDDYYEFVEGASAFVGRRLGKTYAIGDVVRIVVAKADMELRRLDFVLL